MVTYSTLFFAAAVVLLPWASAAGLGPDNRIVSWQYLDSTGTDARARVSTVYFDGLGRERLKVVSGMGGAGGDVAVRTDYDPRGNVGRQWLPVPGGAALLDETAFGNAAAEMYGGDEVPFTRLRYEESGFNRRNGVFGPGKLWNGHGDETSWHRNALSGDHACILLVADRDGTVTAKGMYPVGCLAVSEVTDADGLRTIRFTNRSGNVVCERRIGPDGLRADTRFVYDVRGDLRCTLSPEGSALVPQTGNVSASVVADYGQRYDYDLWHRCVAAKAPGCGAVHYVYNRMDAVCFESTAEQRSRGEWTMTKYDRRRRPAVRGTVVIPGASRESLQQVYGDSLMQEALTPDINRTEGPLMYTDGCGPRGFEPYMAWYYDNYSFIVGPNETIKPRFETSGSDGYTQQTMLTGTAMVESGSGTLWLTAVKYDHRGLPLLSCTWDLYLENRRHTVESGFDFAGNETRRAETVEDMADATVISQRKAVTSMFYDDYGRLTQSRLRVDNSPEIVLSEPEYDAVGRLAADNGALRTEYAYDIRSNVTGITNDRFAQTAWYGHSAASDAPVSYKYINALSTAWFDGQDASGYFGHTASFAYDGLGRFRSSVDDDRMLTEEIAVDLDANVTDIVRRYNGDIVQDAVLSFEGGKVTSVYDNSTPFWSDAVGRFAAGDYALGYDSDGRLVADGTRGITSITYHPFGNLPKKITMADGSYVASDYMPDGALRNRVFATRTIQTVVRVTADGDTIRTSRPITQSAWHRYFGQFESTPGGWLYHTPAGYYDLARGQHYWYVRDRMGSTAAVVDAAGNMVQTTGYYPSGTPYQLPNTAIGTAVDAKTDRLHIGNRWLGHSGLAMYDNTARLHDPVLMRFAAPDPLYSRYPGLSPWSHTASNPLNYIDFKGDSIYDGAMSYIHTTTALNQTFGKNADRFSFSATGAMKFNGNLNGMTGNQKKLLKGLSHYLNSADDHITLYYGDKVSIKDGNNNTQTLNASDGNGAISATKTDNPTLNNNYILINPDTKEIKVFELKDPNSNLAANFVTKNLKTNIADMLFHELGEIIYQADKFGSAKALEYNNIARKILKLPKRKYDEEHNYLH